MKSYAIELSQLMKLKENLDKFENKVEVKRKKRKEEKKKNKKKFELTNLRVFAGRKPIENSH
jgi:hypothetical protein